jgi:hypothetical protein
MMGKTKRNKFAFQKNKTQRNAFNRVRNPDMQIDGEKKKIAKKFFLKLRNKMKYTLLTFFNSKKLNIYNNIKLSFYH